jgi:hypothetical protein
MRVQSKHKYSLTMMPSNGEAKPPSQPSAPAVDSKIDIDLLQKYMLGNQTAEEVFAEKRATTDCGDSPLDLPPSANSTKKSADQKNEGETSLSALQKRLQTILANAVSAPSYNLPQPPSHESFMADPPTFSYKSDLPRTSIEAARRAEHQVIEPMVTVRLEPEEYISSTHHPGVSWRKRDVDLLVEVSQKWKFLPDGESAKRRKNDDDFTGQS